MVKIQANSQHVGVAVGPNASVGIYRLRVGVHTGYLKANGVFNDAVCHSLRHPWLKWRHLFSPRHSLVIPERNLGTTDLSIPNVGELGNESNI